jgi:FkbM family methyltransferase
VIGQVFLEEEYKPLLDVEEPEVIIDCGANIGCTAFYLLSRFPSARLIALEPDPGNFAMCERNLACFGQRATVLRAALWDRDGKLRLDKGTFRDGLDWSCQVRPCVNGETPEVEAVSIPTLLDVHQIRRVDILKIDIEGGEKIVFAGCSHAWLDQVQTIAIELHDQDCRDTFLSAISGQPFLRTRAGEITYCRRHGQRPPELPS